MAGLVKSLGRLVWKKKEERLIIFGNDYSGKTTLLYRLKLGETVTTIPTIGFNVETIQHKGWAYTLWDVGGTSREARNCLPLHD
jgi:ADP-ribosylation factor protein 1